MLGGIWGEHRDLLKGDETDPHVLFEKDVDELLGDKIRSNKEAGRDMWSALANVDWNKKDNEEFGVGYSFRAAGDLVAAIRSDGDYMDWYCSGPDAYVASWIEEALATRGWVPEILL